MEPRKRPPGRPKNPEPRKHIIASVSPGIHKYLSDLAKANRRTITATVEEVIEFHRAGGRK